MFGLNKREAPSFTGCTFCENDAARAERRLAENEWDPTRGRAVAEIVYHFGRADELDPQALRRLSASILRVVDETTGSREEVAPDLHLRDAWPYG